MTFGISTVVGSHGVPSLHMSMCFDCQQAWLFGVVVRVHVWHPVDLGSSLGGMTTLSFATNGVRNGMACHEVIGGVAVKLYEGPPGRLTPV